MKIRTTMVLAALLLAACSSGGDDGGDKVSLEAFVKDQIATHTDETSDPVALNGLEFKFSNDPQAFDDILPPP